jgi:pyruvate/2-oxoglutarate dehydrogenase complex dihydrolipoamide dehydrogenase (E3) component
MAAAVYDAIVIGTGQAGPALAARLAGAGRKVAVIERHKFGGTCVNDGCTPTKTLVASAYAAHLVSRAADYGVEIAGSPRVDMRRVKARKDAVVAASSAGVEKWMRGLKGGKVYQGHGRFTGPKTVTVERAVDG